MGDGKCKWISQMCGDTMGISQTISSMFVQTRVKFWWGKCQKIRYSVTPSHKAYGDVLCDSSAFRLLRLASSNPRRAQSQGSQPSPSAHCQFRNGNLAPKPTGQEHHCQRRLRRTLWPLSWKCLVGLTKETSHWSHWCPMIQWG